jgi:hypothetical protein
MVLALPLYMAFPITDWIIVILALVVMVSSKGGGANESSNLHGMVHNYLPTEGGILEGKKDSISYAVKSFFKPKAVTILQRNILFDQVCQ